MGEHAEGFPHGAHFLKGGGLGDESGLVEGDHGCGEAGQDIHTLGGGTGGDGLEDDLRIRGVIAEGGNFHHREETLQGWAKVGKPTRIVRRVSLTLFHD